MIGQSCFGGMRRTQYTWWIAERRQKTSAIMLIAYFNLEIVSIGAQV